VNRNQRPVMNATTPRSPSAASSTGSTNSQCPTAINPTVSRHHATSSGLDMFMAVGV